LNIAIILSLLTIKANVLIVNEIDVNALNIFQDIASIVNIYLYNFLLFSSLYLLFSINKKGSDSGKEKRKKRGKERGKGREKQIIGKTSLSKTRSSKRIRNANSKII